MVKAKEILFATALVWVTLVPASNTFGLAGLENFLEEKQTFLTELNKEITSLKERIRVPDEQWYFEESCKMSCKLIACLFTRKPASEEELCQQPGNGEHACCEKYAQGSPAEAAEAIESPEPPPDEEAPADPEPAPVEPPPEVVMEPPPVAKPEEHPEQLATHQEQEAPPES